MDLTIIDSNYFPGKRKFRRPYSRYWREKLLAHPDIPSSFKRFDNVHIKKDGKIIASVPFARTKLKRNPHTEEYEFIIKTY